tara:strand:- start:157 stop:1338 length:1182 start_codon:yes stop_codon:yes gene_type:complete
MKLKCKIFGVPESQGLKTYNLNREPRPAVMARGLAGVSTSQYFIEQNWNLERDNVQPTSKNENKPAYKVPSMDEIKAIPWNGFKVASTFSGAGGSCLGYRMAGFRVVWANEFVPAAQDSYNENKSPQCYLNTKDIRELTADDVLSEANLKPGELDLFDGSPPCQAFSSAGKRSKGWGKSKKYEHGAAQKNEELFTDYIRLLNGLQPKVFVAENVRGLVMGQCKGMFLEILQGLKDCGYNVKAKVLDAQWLGVPQVRRRVIFVGVRNDLKQEPAFPNPLLYRYSVRDALPWISDVRQSVYGGTDQRSAKGKPCPTVTASGGIGAAAGKQCWIEFTKADTKHRQFTIAELKAICSFPDDFVLTGSYAQQWERLGNSVPPLMMKAIAKTIRDEVLQ